MNPRQAELLYGVPNPFVSSPALRSSNYSAFVDGELVRLLDWRQPTAQARMADQALRGFLGSDAFSCVAAKATLVTGGYRFGYYQDIGGTQYEGLARDLAAFVSERSGMDTPYATFVAVFEECSRGTEREFERRLWKTLQSLQRLGARYFPWDARVSDDPSSPRFGFSFAEQAFFVVGMHPNSARQSRRFFLPALAFNLHAQFDVARENGQFKNIQRAVREREIALQGSINPQLADFGAKSEALQYSGRVVEEGWKCPFFQSS